MTQKKPIEGMEDVATPVNLSPSLNPPVIALTTDKLLIPSQAVPPSVIPEPSPTSLPQPQDELGLVLDSKELLLPNVPRLKNPLELPL
jgi:hypothetical protein